MIYIYLTAHQVLLCPISFFYSLLCFSFCLFMWKYVPNIQAYKCCLFPIMKMEWLWLIFPCGDYCSIINWNWCVYANSSSEYVLQKFRTRILFSLWSQNQLAILVKNCAKKCLLKRWLLFIIYAVVKTPWFVHIGN